MTVILIVALLIGVGSAIYARVFFKRFIEERQKRESTIALFSRYVAPPVVEELLARKDPRLFEARAYYATIVCVRIRNFALLAERLTPEETLRYLNEFYTIVGQAVQRHRGMIESLRGDTVNAVFGVLVEEQFQEERALRTALDVMRLMKAMESRWGAQGRKAIAIGIGVNSGKIVAGDTGFAQRREFAIVGTPAHIAARLEEVSEELHATIVASQSTYDAVRDLFVGVPTSLLPLRGLRGLQEAYIVRGLSRRAAENDSLTMPAQSSFKQTSIYAEEPQVAPVEADTYVGPQERETVRLDAARTPASTVDERVGGHAALETSKFSRFDSEHAMLPEPPPIQGTYEDDQGPPFQLLP